MAKIHSEIHTLSVCYGDINGFGAIPALPKFKSIAATFNGSVKITH